jgi:hypothetical protein
VPCCQAACQTGTAGRQSPSAHGFFLFRELLTDRAAQALDCGQQVDRLGRPAAAGARGRQPVKYRQYAPALAQRTVVTQPTEGL